MAIPRWALWLMFLSTVVGLVFLGQDLGFWKAPS
jgi:hypothetical protein